MASSALVTGASTGIGRATALRLDSAGWRVFAGVRKEEDAEALRGGRLGAHRAADPRRHRRRPDRRCREADRSRGRARRADGLVNNAGIGVPSPLETIPMEDFRRQVEVNLTGHLAVTQAMLPAIRRAPRPGSSSSARSAGRIAFPLNGAYHAAKFGIEAVGDVFRQELRPWGISVSIVEPGSIDTPIWERGERIRRRARRALARARSALWQGDRELCARSARDSAERGIPPEQVASKIEHALSARRPRTRYLVGIDAKLQARAKHLRSRPRPSIGSSPGRPVSEASSRSRNPSRLLLY